jgi:hypothetical protein
MKLSKASIALLVIQLAIVSTIAAKYLYQRWTCPRVWVRTVVYDPVMLMRGRYLSTQLIVDGCQSTLPSAEQAQMPRDLNGVQTGKTFSIRADRPVEFSATLKVGKDKLVAIRVPESDARSTENTVQAIAGSSCQDFRLLTPVDFYIAEHAANPASVKPGQELWIEVTIPPKGPPRPIQVALKQNGAWTPLAFQ